MIPWLLSESFQETPETGSITENIVESALPRSFARGHLDEPIDEHLERTVDAEDTMHVMTNHIFGSQAFITPFDKSVKPNSQKILGKLRPSTMIKEFIEAGSCNNRKCLVAVSLQPKSTSATPP